VSAAPNCTEFYLVNLLRICHLSDIDFDGRRTLNWSLEIGFGDMSASVSECGSVAGICELVNES
jgi:hypothetical protein